METLIAIWDNDIGVTRGFSTPGKPGWNQVLRRGIGACNAFHAAKTNTGSRACHSMCIKIECLYRAMRVSALQENLI